MEKIIVSLGKVRFSTRGMKILSCGWNCGKEIRVPVFLLWLTGLAVLVLLALLKFCKSSVLLQRWGYGRSTFSGDIGKRTRFFNRKEVIELPSVGKVIKDEYCNLYFENKMFLQQLRKLFNQLERWEIYNLRFFLRDTQDFNYVSVLELTTSIQDINIMVIIDIIHALAKVLNNDERYDLGCSVILEISKDGLLDSEIEDISNFSNKLWFNKGGIPINRRDYSTKSTPNHLKSVEQGVDEKECEKEDFDTRELQEVEKVFDTRKLQEEEKVSLDINNKEMDTIAKLKKELEMLENEISLLTSRGFVIYREFVSNQGKFPLLVDKMLKYLQKPSKYKNVSNKNLFGFITNETLVFIINWVYQIKILELYLKFADVLAELKERGVDIKESDIAVDLVSDMRILYSKIDPSIRVKMIKKGINITHNVYTGFDTEYEKIDMDHNKLLSAQLAVGFSTLVQIPYMQDYSMVKIDPLDNKKYELGVNFNKLETEIVLKEEMVKDINRYINYIRMINDKGYSDSMKFISNILREKGFKSIVDKEKEIEIFITEDSPIYTWIRRTDNISLKEITAIANNISKDKIDKQYGSIIEILKEGYDRHKEERLIKQDGVKQIDCRKDEFGSVVDDVDIVRVEDTGVFEQDSEDFGKFLSRTRFTSFTDHDKGVSVSRRWKTYIVGHMLYADLTMLKDFYEFKDSLKIINKSMVSGNLEVDGMRLVLRDTALLAPARSSLDSIGKMLGGKYLKVDVDKHWKENMGKFLLERPEEFEKYAIQDSVVALVHCLRMEKFVNTMGIIGIPITIPAIASNYIRKVWRDIGYKGYQIKGASLGDISEVYTPVVLRKTEEAALELGMYIKNYRGGRNESFMYGIDKEMLWYDYDLTSAYTTVMSMLGDPDYSKGKIIFRKEIEQLSDEALIKSYIIIKASFIFPKNTKYPSIPVSVDEDLTIYPLKGDCVLTGAEYVLAKNQGCGVYIKYGYYIPFRENGIKPFAHIMKTIQAERRKYPKKTFMNELMKLIGNSGYGIVCKGFSNKTKFDISTQSSIKLKGNDLTNPVLGSWITAFVRSVIGELLHNIHLLGGIAVSVTTDGFITNIENLEEKIIESDNPIIKKNTILLTMYREIREWLSGDKSGLEVKHSEIKGLISWTTRGQYSLDGKVSAMTGLQKRAIKDSDLGVLLHNTIENESKSFGYIQSRLRSALEVYKTEKHVTMLFSDRNFNMYSDNKRKFLLIKWNEGFYDSVPYWDISQCMLNRAVAKIGKTEVYNKMAPVNTVSKKYGSYLEMAVRKFIRCLFTEEFNLCSESFKNYAEIVHFVKNHTGGKMTINAHTISLLKRRHVIHGALVEVKEVTDFINGVQQSGKFPNFDSFGFLNENMKSPSPGVISVKAR